MKLKKMKKYFERSKVALWNNTKDRYENKSWRALNLAVELLTRVLAEEFSEENSIYKKFADKWGELVYNKKESGNEWDFWEYENVKNEEEKDECFKDLSKTMTSLANISNRNRRNFYKIVEKYGMDWWD
jgi:hypothetical protein